MTIEFFHKTKNDRNTIFGFYVTIFFLLHPAKKLRNLFQYKKSMYSGSHASTNQKKKKENITLIIEPQN